MISSKVKTDMVKVEEANWGLEGRTSVEIVSNAKTACLGNNGQYSVEAEHEGCVNLTAETSTARMEYMILYSGN